MAEENQNPESDDIKKKKVGRKKRAITEEQVIDYSKNEKDSNDAPQQSEVNEINELLYGKEEIEKVVVFEQNNSSEMVNDKSEGRRKKILQISEKAREKFQVFAKKIDQIKNTIIEQMSAEQDKKLKIPLEDKMEPSLLSKSKTSKDIKREDNSEDLNFIEEGPIDLFKMDEDTEDIKNSKSRGDTETKGNTETIGDTEDIKEQQTLENDSKPSSEEENENISENLQDKTNFIGEGYELEDEIESNQFITRSKKIEASALEFLNEQIELEENIVHTPHQKKKNILTQSSVTIDLIQDIAKRHEEKQSKREHSREKYWFRQLFSIYQYTNQPQNTINLPLRNKLYLLMMRILYNIKCNTELLEIKQQVESIENIFKEFTIFEEIQ